MEHKSGESEEKVKKQRKFETSREEEEKRTTKTGNFTTASLSSFQASLALDKNAEDAVEK